MVERIIALLKQLFCDQAEMPQKSGDQSSAETVRKEAVEKYKHLYDYSAELLKEETERFHKADDKAAKYATNSLLLIGATAFFGKWIAEKIIPPQTVIEWWIICMGSLALACSFASWVAANWVLRVRELTRRPLNADWVAMYDREGLFEIYKNVAENNVDAFEKNETTTLKKYRWLNRAFVLLMIATGFLIALTTLYAVYSWQNPARFQHDYEFKRHKPRESLCHSIADGIKRRKNSSFGGNSET